MFTCSNEKMIEYLKSKDILITKTRLSTLKQKHDIFTGVEYLNPIYVSEYQYNENDIWF